MLERAKAVTANGTHTYVEYARYAELPSESSGHRAKLDVRVNEEKSRIVDLSREEK